MNPPSPTTKNPNKVLKFGNIMLEVGAYVDNPIEWGVTNDGLGMLTGTLKRVIHVPIGQRCPDSSLPNRGDYHPFDERLRFKDYSVSYQANDMAVASINYVGLATDPTGVTWDWNGPTDDIAIDMHPEFPSWGTIFGTKPPKSQDKPKDVPDDSVVFSDKWGTVNWNVDNVEVDSNQRFVQFRTTKEMKALDLPGVRAFKVPRATLRVSYSTARTSGFTWAVSNLGQWYDSIPFDEVEREIPTNVSPKNWLLTSTSISAFAGIYKVQVEFTLSGRKGWNKLIYKKSGGGGSKSMIPATLGDQSWKGSTRSSWGS